MAFAQNACADLKDRADTGTGMRQGRCPVRLLANFVAGSLAIVLDATLIAGSIAIVIDATLCTSLFNLLIEFALSLPGVAARSRRLHFADRAVWWWLLAFGIVGIAALFYSTGGARRIRRAG